MTDLYQVRLLLEGAVWVDVEADSEEEAVERARATYSVVDAEWHHVTNVEVKRP